MQRREHNTKARMQTRLFTQIRQSRNVFLRARHVRGETMAECGRRAHLAHFMWRPVRHGGKNATGKTRQWRQRLAFPQWGLPEKTTTSGDLFKSMTWHLLLDCRRSIKSQSTGNKWRVFEFGFDWSRRTLMVCVFNNTPLAIIRWSNMKFDALKGRLFNILLLFCRVEVGHWNPHLKPSLRHETRIWNPNPGPKHRKLRPRVRRLLWAIVGFGSLRKTLKHVDCVAWRQRDKIQNTNLRHWPKHDISSSARSNPIFKPICWVKISNPTRATISDYFIIRLICWSVGRLIDEYAIFNK